MMAGAQPLEARAMKILIIDDHVLIREALRVILRELKGEGLHILEASDSRQAMRQIDDEHDLDLVATMTGTGGGTPLFLLGACRTCIRASRHRAHPARGTRCSAANGEFVPFWK